MDISSLSSSVTAPLSGPVSEDAIRRHTFRHLLGCAGGNGGLLVDLGANACTFAKIARDDGYAVTAVDARIENKPPQEELESIRFVQSDLRKFDVKGFDIIVFLGLLDHFDLGDQIQMLERCAQADVPVILETQIHVDGPVPASETRDSAPKLVARGPYEGVVGAVDGTATAWIGNKESFRPTEESILRMFADVGFKKVAIVDPLLTSNSGARRFFLLNCESPAREQTADIVQGERKYITNLVNHGRFDEARELYEAIASVPTGEADWRFELAIAQMRLHFGERDKAVATVLGLRDRALDLPQYVAPALLACARFFETAGDKSEAEKTKGLAMDRVGNAAAVKTWVGRLIAGRATDSARYLLAEVARSFADNFEMLNVVALGYQQLGDFGSAERIRRIALEREPQNAAMLASLGYALLSQDKHEEAGSAFERALALEPNDTKIPERLISIYLKLKRFEDAERHARALLGLSPDDPRIHYYLASALRNTKRRPEALEHARRAAELDPANERYHKYADDLATLVVKTTGETPSSGAEVA